MPDTPRKLPTTGRLASRMSTTEQAILRAALQAYAPEAAFLQDATTPLEVELGIGDGAALYARAQADPACRFLGTEIFLNGLEKLLRQQRKAPLPNLRLSNTDARDLLVGTLPPATVDRLLILFPDPWPKSKHHKRRLLQPELLDAAARALKPGAELWLVSDWPDYVYHGISVLYAHPHFALQMTPLADTSLTAGDCKPSARLPYTSGVAALSPLHLATPPAWWQPTKYQQKAAVAGRQPWFIKAIRIT